MSEIKIEKGIPIPSKRRNAGQLVQTVKSLEIGDSFAIPEKKLGSSLSGVTYASKKTGVTLVSRKIEGGMRRFWRIA